MKNNNKSDTDDDKIDDSIFITQATFQSDDSFRIVFDLDVDGRLSFPLPNNIDLSDEATTSKIEDQKLGKSAATVSMNIFPVLKRCNSNI